MKITCALVDDEPLALDLLESYVQKTPFLELSGCYSSAVIAMEGIKENPVDLIFLDIQMPELDGLQFSRMIDNNTRVIFTTAFNQYAVEGYRVNALDYLLKPISYPEFLESAAKALHWFELAGTTEANNLEENQPTDAIYVKSDYKLIRIEIEDILYIEGLKDYIKIYVTTQKKPIISLMSMKGIELRLPKNKFMRVHRSYIVQIDKVQVFEKGNIMFGEKAIPISETYKDTIQSYIDKHLLSK